MPANSAGQSSGEQEAAKFWSKYIAFCSGSHYARNAPGVFIELRGFRIQMKYDSITEADRLNRIEEKGQSWFEASAYRIYSNSSWHAWGNGIPKDMQLTNSVRFQKAHGRWNFYGVGYFNDYAKTVSCSDVPGFRSTTMNEVPTNTVQIDDYHNFPIESFIFWDSKTNLVRDKFPQSTTTYVNWKITFTGTAFDYSLPPVESYWYKNGEQWSYDGRANRDNVSGGHLWAGKGWDEPGHWEAGTYTVKVYLRKQLIAQRSFKIVSDESLPGEVRFDGLYYQRFQNGSYWFFRLFRNGAVRDLGGPSKDNFESLLENAWRCTDDDIINGMFSSGTFDYYCKDFNLGQGTYSVQGSQIEFTTNSKFHRADGGINFKGTITNTGLKLNWDSRALNISGADIFTYTRCPFRDCGNTR